MKTRHSNSLLFIWQLAEIEARYLKCATIEPVHFLLALCKSVDLDLTAVPRKDSTLYAEVLEELLREVRQLRSIFDSARLDAKVFRRALRRRSMGNHPESSDIHRLRRSRVSKKIFADIETLASVGNSPVYPVHLLYGLLCLEDISRDDLLDQSGFDPSLLKSVVKSTIFSGSPKTNSSPGRN